MSVFDVKPTKSAGEGGTWEIPEADNHLGCLVALIDLGTHREAFKGEEAKDTHKIYLLWELTEAPMSGTDRNHLIGQRYTLSLNEKAGLYKMLKAAGERMVDGEPFPLRSLLGKPVLVTVNHTPPNKEGKVYADFGGFSQLPKAMKNQKVTPKVTPFFWEMPTQPGTTAGSVADKALQLLEAIPFLPRIYGQKIPEIIVQSKEWRALEGRAPLPATGAAPRSAGKAAEQAPAPVVDELQEAPF